MKTRTKVALTVLCALLLVTVSILGTLAYLTSKTTTVTNTFTVGNVKITLDEAKVDEYGVEVSPAERVTTGNTYKLIPGHSYVKDPTIHVAEGSEPCFVFVKVENAISAIEDGSSIATQMTNNNWVSLGNDVYYYDTNTEDETIGTKVDARTNAENLPVFSTFTVAGNANVANYATETEGAKTKVINVTAYAVQADGFANANAAWSAAFGA